MGFAIGILTFVMVVDSLALILLVLIQLPKKEAGAGLAFGGAATDALFGAGSGNVLTKITKYAAAIFFILAVVLSHHAGLPLPPQQLGVPELDQPAGQPDASSHRPSGHDPAHAHDPGAGAPCGHQPAGHPAADRGNERAQQRGQTG